MPVVLKRADSEIITQFFDSVINDVAISQAEKGLKASGDSVDGLVINIVNDSLGQLIDTSGSFYYQEVGRGEYKGGTAIKGGVWGKIYTWLRYKKYGFDWKDKEERIQMAWAITKKIQSIGTYTHLHGRTNVVSDAITPEKINAVSIVFAQKYAVEALSDIVDEFKK